MEPRLVLSTFVEPAGTPYNPTFNLPQNAPGDDRYIIEGKFQDGQNQNTDDTHTFILALQAGASVSLTNQSGGTEGYYVQVNGPDGAVVTLDPDVVALPNPGAAAAFKAAVAGSYKIAIDPGGFQLGGAFTLKVDYAPAQGITPTGLAFDPSDGGVDFSYVIGGADLTGATTVVLYWAAGTTTNTEIGAPFSGTTTATARGSYGPVKSARRFIPDPPPGAKYILAVADPNNLVRQEDGVTNVAALPIPSLSISHLDWNTDRDVILPDGTVANYAHRGVDYGYTVGQANLPIETTVAFYWAKGVDLKDIIGAAVDQTTGQASNWLLKTTKGPHDNDRPTDGYAYNNDPARWGTPPPGAKYILAVADPEDKVIKQAHTDRNGIDIVGALPLATAADVLSRSVSVTTTGPSIDATFQPGKGSGLSITMSEAEVVLGVEHFNWQQVIYHVPSSWHPLIAHGPVPERATVSTLYGISRVPATVAMVDPSTGQLLLHPIRLVNGKLTVDPSTTISSTDTPTPFLDPLILNDPADRRAYAIPSASGKLYIFTVGIIGEPPDAYRPYWNETATDLGKNLKSGKLTFYDRPSMALFLDPFQPDAVPVNPYGADGYKGFWTSLVGVGYNPKQITQYDGHGYRVDFVWRSNSQYNGYNVPPLGILYGLEMWDKTPPSADLPAVVSGGISGVQLVDQPPAGAGADVADIALSPSVAGPTYGQALSFTAAVRADSPAGPTPTGTVQFLIDGNPLGAAVPLVGGVATSPSIATLAAGGHAVSAVYSGDLDFAAVTSTPLTEAVARAPLTIVAEDSARGYGQPNLPLNLDYYGFVDGDTPASLAALPVMGTFANFYSMPGTYAIVAGGAASNNYAINYRAGTMTVAQPAWKPGDIGVVTTLYDEVLGRVPTPGELTLHLDLLAIGATPAAEAAALYATTERAALVAVGRAPRIAPARALSDGLRAGREIAIVSALYADILGSAPDAAGLIYWSGQLASGAPAAEVGAAVYDAGLRLYRAGRRPAPRPLGPALADAMRTGAAYWPGS